MSESARSYTSHALPSVTNLLPRKKKSQSSKCQSSGKENWGSNVNMVSLLIPPSKMAAMSRAVSLSPEDNRMTF
jgi:RES domain-containing protein